MCGMIIQGIAKSTRNPFATTYVDDNVEKKKTAMYMGIITGITVFGPVLAFGIGGVFSRMYVTLEDVHITPRHPSWVGAWWLGFLVFGCISVVVAFPLLLFPRSIKPSRHNDTSRIRSPSSNCRSAVFDFFTTISRLLKNDVYLPMVLCVSVKLFGTAGIVSFLPKYMETQFSIPAWRANILIGGLNVIMAAFGTILGGCMITKRKWSPLACIKFLLVVNTVSTVLCGLNFVFGCDNVSIIGLNQPERNLPDSNNTCSEVCGCNNNTYFPVCGSNNVNFQNPCLAGCTMQRQMTFQGCSCIGSNATASPGLCESACKMIFPFIANMSLIGLLSSTGIIPYLIVKLRSVHEKDRAMSVGFSSLCTTLSGWLAGPIVSGSIIDTACLVWNTSKNGKGACALYDNNDFRLKLISFHTGAMFVSLCILYFVFLRAGKKTDWSTEEKAADNGDTGEPMLPVQLYSDSRVPNTTS